MAKYHMRKFNKLHNNYHVIAMHMHFSRCKQIQNRSNLDLMNKNSQLYVLLLKLLKFYGKNNCSSQAMVTKSKLIALHLIFLSESGLGRDSSATMLGVVFCNYSTILVRLFIR